ncbi:hypothetical protein ACQUYR_03600 [Lentilactobacillus otakiensis]|uniref:hypothetical protein n=1 Tax=Lentilactobacillus otakiensis TaxID=481720 RepID=UPI003D18723D
MRDNMNLQLISRKYSNMNRLIITVIIGIFSLLLGILSSGSTANAADSTLESPFKFETTLNSDKTYNSNQAFQMKFTLIKTAGIQAGDQMSRAV